MLSPQVLLLYVYLKKLRLPTMLKHYRKLASQAAQANMTHEQYLHAIAELEVNSRESNAQIQRIRQARFPTTKTLEQFEFSAVPSLNKPLILKLAQGDYITEAKNVIFGGDSGTGKSHLAIALGIEVCAQGHHVGFYTAAELVNSLLEAKVKYQLSRLEKKLMALDVLIVDELGYLALDENGVKLLFNVFSNRYERKSTLVTTNLPLEEWDTVFKDPAMTVALVDRLTHHCHLVQMNGDSYRFKQSLHSQQTV
jgi:DNA replication protein DnaC